MNDDKPNLKVGIYRVLHTLVVGGSRLTAESDFIYRQESNELLAVLEWGGPSTSQFPLVTLPLDPALLSEDSSRPGYYTYSGQLVDPRKRQ